MLLSMAFINFNKKNSTTTFEITIFFNMTHQVLLFRNLLLENIKIFLYGFKIIIVYKIILEGFSYFFYYISTKK